MTLTHGNKPKILWLSDSSTTVTGYANQTMNILNRLKGFEKHQQAHNYVGQDIRPGLTFKDGTKLDFWLHGTGTKPYSQDLLVPRIRELGIDIFGILLDSFMTYPWLLNLDFAPAKTFFYFPTDGENKMPQGCDAILRKVHFPICMSKFGQAQVKREYNIDVDHIPHGVDSKQFFPLKAEDKKKLKEDTTAFVLSNNALVPIKGALQDKFVIGVVARNQGRKMLDRTFKAMSLIKPLIPEAVLFLHTDPADSAGVHNLQQLIIDYNLENRVFFSGMNFYKGFEHKQMNSVYNVMDIFFLSTSGEGFCIPIIEAMSAGIPVVATDYTTTKELVTDNDCGIAIKLNTTILGNWNVERGVMDIQDAADVIVKLHQDKKLMKKYSINGRKAVLKIYDWPVVMKLWQNKMKQIMES